MLHSTDMLDRVPPLAHPGSLEIDVARRFFDALQRGSAKDLCALLDDGARLENMDGPLPTEGREALARRLADHAPDVEYRLEFVEARPGWARAVFQLLVEEVPGGVDLEAHLVFVDTRILSIRVGQFTAQGAPPSLDEAPRGPAA